MATVVAFHAHPDDEVLLTGGTLALLAAEGHRVVIVVATEEASVPSTRLDELRASAAILGVQRVAPLGYADSGHGAVVRPDPPGRQRFVRAPTSEAAARLADLLRSEEADVLLSYDANGGYGHPDHVKVHEVGAHAASLAGVPRVLEATMPHDHVLRVARVIRALRIPFRYNLSSLGYSPAAAITHRLDVRRYARQKQAALAAHRSVVSGRGRLAPLMRLFVRLPVPLFALLAGREWYVDPALTPVAVPATTLFPT